MDFNNLKKEERHIKVRCVDPKNNSIIMIPAHAVLENCKTYGLIIQDPAIKKELKDNELPVKVNNEDAKPIELNEEEMKQLRESYEKKVGKPAGKKRADTLLKEIAEAENK